MRYLVTGYKPDEDVEVSQHTLEAADEQYLVEVLGLDDTSQLVADDHRLSEEMVRELVARFHLDLVPGPQDYFLEVYGDGEVPGW
jgi:hypothetical protein